MFSKDNIWAGLLISGLVYCPFSVSGQQVLPRYKDAKAPVEERVSDLLGRMNREEKIGQLSTQLGWEMYDKKEKTVTVSSQFKKAVAESHIGNLWATLRADPWTKKTLSTGLDPYLAAEATNELQRYVREHTRLQIPLFIAEECPHGHMAIGTTVFPTSIGQSSTWNPELILQMASVIAREARLQGAHIGYGPVLDLAREPRWSRVEETYGEDPVLNSIMGVAMVKGFQGSTISSGENVISTLKHFAAYGVPEGGHNGGAVSIGTRELYQSYLPPFKAAVEAGALSVMTAYNSIDGIPCSANSWLMNDVLREQWGFKGFVVSDLGSINGLLNSNHVAADMTAAAAMAINAGMDNDLGGLAFSAPLIEAVNKGAVSEQLIDKAVGRILKLKFEMGLFENPYVKPRLAKQIVRNTAAVALSRQVARESIVLLKNEKDILPLMKHVKSVAVIGPNADHFYNQLGDYTAPQDSANVITVLEGIRAKLPSSAQIRYVKGCDIRDTIVLQIEEAVAAVKASEVTVLVIGGSSARDFKTEYKSTGAATVSQRSSGTISDMESGEGYDRETLDLLGKQLVLMQAVVNTGKPVIVVFIGGRPLNLNWADAHASAIINAWYPGQEGGNAIADVLFGDYNPAGRLPVSVPRSVGQLPVYYNYKNPLKHDYVEGSSAPLYDFGYGLSYSKFVYHDMQVGVSETADLEVAVSVALSNVSDVDGDEVLQLYVRDEAASVVVPVKQLKAFRRIHLKAHETKTVSFKLIKNDLMIYNQSMEPVVEAGTFNIMIGAGAKDIRLEKKINIHQNYNLK